MKKIDRFHLERDARQAQSREIARLAGIGADRIVGFLSLLVAAVKEARTLRARGLRTRPSGR